MDSPKSDTDAKEDVRRLTNLLEESMQEAHELRSKLQISEKCIQNYEAELEALQQDVFEKDKQHASAIRLIEEEKSNVLKDAEERILNWQLEYQTVSEKLTNVQKELEEKSVNTENLTKEKNETTALYNELQETMEALTTSTAALDQNKQLISVLQTEKRELAQHVEMLEENLQYYKENLSIVKAQLSAQTEEFKEIQEQLAVTQSELATLRATPDVKSRGNSLFAEVEDNRQQMAKDYKLMLAKFGYMKKDYSVKCSEIAKLKKENAILADKLELAEKEAKKHYKAFVENYEIRIKELQMSIKDLRNDVKPVYLNGNESILKFAEQTVVNSRKEITSLRNEMELRSALRLSEAAELLKTQGELAQARAELRKSFIKIAELTAALNEKGTFQPASTASDSVSLEGKPTIKTEIPKTYTNDGFCPTVLRKPREVVFEEGLLHDKFDSRKRDAKDDIAVQEDSCIEDVEVSQAADEKMVVLNEATVKMEVADESSQNGNVFINENGTYGMQNDVEVGTQEVLDMEDRASGNSSLEENCEVDEKPKTMGSLIRETRLIQEEDTVEGIDKQIKEDSFRAALIHSPSSSEYLEPKNIESLGGELRLIEAEDIVEESHQQNKTENSFRAAQMISPSSSKYLESEEEMKIDSMLDVNFSPLSSDKKYLNEDYSRPVNKRLADGNVCNDSDSEPLADTLRFDSEKIPSSILKVHTSCPFENTEVKVKKEVNFDRDTKENVGLDEKCSDTSQESNKENSTGGTDINVKAETKPTRRRPRPKQTQPIIYIT